MLGTDSTWILDDVKNAWVAQFIKEGNKTLQATTLPTKVTSQIASTSSMPTNRKGAQDQCKNPEHKEHWFYFENIDWKVSVGLVTTLAAASILYLLVFPRVVIQNPKILLSRLWVIFDVICFLLALYMALRNIGRFSGDANKTVVTYKKYGYTAEDIYPTFSVCFEGNELYRFNESAIFTAYGIHLNDYEMMLDGKQAFQYDYDPISRRYNKSSLSQNFQPRIGFKSQDLFQSHEIVKTAIFASENPSQNIFFERKESISTNKVAKESPFYISYQLPKLYCLTQKDIYTSNIVKHHDSLVVDMSFLEYNSKLKLFIHYPGQLLRSFDTPRLEISLDRIQNEALRISVSQTTLLRKRSVQYDSCNNNISDHDLFLLESVTNVAACIPPYWRNIIGTSSNLIECSSPEQLKKVHDLTKDYKNILEDRDTPCLGMFSVVVWNEGRQDDSKKICEKCTYLEIIYLDKYYEEIKEIRDLSFEDFLSNLGGFIGIFLGYSMMQIPQLLGMAMHQITLLFASLQLYWKTYFSRNGVSNHEDCCSGEVNEAQNSPKNDLIVSLKSELNEINLQIINQKKEIIDTLKNDLEKIKTRQYQEVTRRIEHIEQTQIKTSLQIYELLTSHQ